MNRGGRPVQQTTPAQTPSTHGSPEADKLSPRGSKLKDNGKAVRATYVAFLGLVTVLLVAVLLSLVFAKDVGSREQGFVKDDKFQAVFLNGGQVYFGKINDLNSKYLQMSNIYYLRVNQQVQPDQQNNANAANDISLVKLGCELHGPEDSMVINREQVIFWENLKTDGQVAKAVEEYVKANPDGQDCNQQQGASTPSSAPASTAPAATTPNARTPAATPPATPGTPATR
ncbi:MAG: hypothetical protein ACR2FM_03815 [Candidatus Saccharimonadales bacterium]